MTRNRVFGAFAAFCTLAIGGAGMGDEHGHEHKAPVASPEWDKLKALVGNWEGTAEMNGKPMPTRTSFKLISGGSVLMNTLAEGTPHEMVTMFHMDKKDLIATHYCAAQNQPRFKGTAGKEPNQVVFDFTDGTNIAPGEGHMQRLVVTMVDGDHHYEDWTFRDHGKDTTNRFDFHRAREASNDKVEHTK